MGEPKLWNSFVSFLRRGAISQISSSRYLKMKVQIDWSNQIKQSVGTLIRACDSTPHTRNPAQSRSSSENIHRISFVNYEKNQNPERLLSFQHITTTGSSFLLPKPTPFDGPGDGILGRLHWRLRPCSPIPSLFRRYNSGQLSMADCPRSPPQTSLFCPFRCSSLLPLFWVLFKSSLLGPHVPGLCFHGPLSSPLRFDYLLLGVWLSHWMVSGIDLIFFVIGFIIDGTLQIERSDCNCIFRSFVVLYFVECN